jgi:hypothetical protein
MVHEGSSSRSASSHGAHAQAGATSRVPCTSGKSGDFKYKSCAPFCSETSRASHCGWCKCSACSFCGTGKRSSPPAGLAAASASSPVVGSLGTTAHTPHGEPPADMATAKLYAALRAAEARAKQAEARLAASEKQLGLCRHSAAELRASTGAHGLLQPSTSSGGAPNWSRRGSAGHVNSTAAMVCSEAVDWAMRLGEKQGLWPLGLNATSGRAAIQEHLRLHDPSSRCGASLPWTSTVTLSAEEEAEEAYVRREEAFASALLMLGVLLCALCNAWALGYLQPNRHVRAMLQYVGLPTAPIVR